MEPFVQRFVHRQVVLREFEAYEPPLSKCNIRLRVPCHLPTLGALPFLQCSGLVQRERDYKVDGCRVRLLRSVRWENGLHKRLLGPAGFDHRIFIDCARLHSEKFPRREAYLEQVHAHASCCCSFVVFPPRHQTIHHCVTSQHHFRIYITSISCV